MYSKERSKACKIQSLSPAQCNELQERLYRRDEARVIEDLAGAKMGCRQDNLSEAECKLRKEEGIKEIEKNFRN